MFNLVFIIGWSAAEFMATRILPLWVGARGVEFEWKYILLSFDGNISLVNRLLEILFRLKY